MIYLYSTSITKVSDLITPKMSILSTSKNTMFEDFLPRGAVSLFTTEMARFGLPAASFLISGDGVWRGCFCTLLAKIVAFSRCMVFKVLFHTLKGLCHGGFHIFWSKLS